MDLFVTTLPSPLQLALNTTLTLVTSLKTTCCFATNYTHCFAADFSLSLGTTAFFVPFLQKFSTFFTLFLNMLTSTSWHFRTNSFYPTGKPNWTWTTLRAICFQLASFITTATYLPPLDTLVAHVHQAIVIRPPSYECWNQSYLPKPFNR
jgi:hypothetical protein